MPRGSQNSNIDNSRNAARMSRVCDNVIKEEREIRLSNGRGSTSRN